MKVEVTVKKYLRRLHGSTEIIVTLPNGAVFGIFVNPDEDVEAKVKEVVAGLIGRRFVKEMPHPLIGKKIIVDVDTEDFQEE